MSMRRTLEKIQFITSVLNFNYGSILEFVFLLGKDANEELALDVRIGRAGHHNVLPGRQRVVTAHLAHVREAARDRTKMSDGTSHLKQTGGHDKTTGETTIYNSENI